MATFDASTGVIDGSVSPTLFFSADVLALSDGAAVSSVDDIANAANWVQATGGKQPLYKTNIFGSKPSVRFDGTDDLLVVTAGSAADRGTVIALLKPTSTITTSTSFSAPVTTATSASNAAVGMFLGSVTGAIANEIVTVASPAANFSAWAASGATLSSSSPHIITLRWNSGTTRYDIFHDGGSNLTSSVTGTRSITNSTVATLGESSVSQFPFAGDIGVVLFYAAVLTDAQKAAAHSYLKDQWGATAADYDSAWAGGASTFNKGFFGVV